MTNRKKLGEIFVEKGLITELTLQRALARAKRLKAKLGIVLEDIEVITGAELAEALAIQFKCKTIANFARYSYSPELFRLIPADVALQNLIFPLKIENGKFAIAMSDPAGSRIVANIATNNDLTIIPFVATRKDIIAAINRHYLGKDATAPTQKTVMIVEDNKMILTMLHNMLATKGYRVAQAENGMEAYKAAIAEPPHVIVTDKEIPKLDGYGLFEALKSLPETRHIPIILLTGTSDPEEEARAFEKGFFDFLTKPVREATLITRVNRAYQSISQVYGIS
ncbi:MAG TPA: response regulator [Geobacteraceae bacterium]|nr:response regulator [Geobacteraceae bacterium]